MFTNLKFGLFLFASFSLSLGFWKYFIKIKINSRPEIGAISVFYIYMY